MTSPQKCKKSSPMEMAYHESLQEDYQKRRAEYRGLNEVISYDKSIKPQQPKE